MFAPAPLAYLWLWPNVSGWGKMLAQGLVYLYFLVGCVVIGRRRWSWSELGLTRRGLGLGLALGVVITAGRWLVVKGVDWGIPPPELIWNQVLADLLYYFLVVGLVEELLFRGVLYHAIATWKGAGWAIAGSSVLFGLYHIGWQGFLGALAGVLIGGILALARWRGIGIPGLALVHGLMDIVSVWSIAELSPLAWQGISIAQPELIIAGYVLLLAAPLYLWKGQWFPL
jgi:membrane protease YdiL (CAAX protease family)